VEIQEMLLKNLTAHMRKSLAYGALGTLALGLYSESTLAQTKLIGYIPSYAGMTAVADRTDFSKLTHVNIAFANPTANGAIGNDVGPMCMVSPSGGNVPKGDIAYVVNKAHAAGAKVLVSLAGGGLPACAGDWKTLLRDSRTGLVNNIVSFINSSNLDGVDVDIEGELLTAIDTAGNYTPFIQALRNALPGKLITAATDSYNGGMLPVSAIQYFDFVNIMSYDGAGPGRNVGGEHSSYAKAQTDIATWQNRGLPKSKLVLGVPFYGVGFNGMPAGIAFKDILANYGVAQAQSDVVGTRCSTCAYISYNGIPTIQAKTQLAMDQGSGVMIWDLSQDASGSNSLLAAIRNKIGGGSTGGTTITIQAEAYTNQSGVQLEGTTDAGGGQNVGWIDNGDWMSYTNINIPSSGSYRIEYRVASVSGGVLAANLNTNQIAFASVGVPATGGWQAWTTVSQTVNINAGNYTFGIYAATGGWNINWIKFTKL
jgi:GH18 family chitinase